ncbi:hypothetical protein D3C80_1631290 [compost metagenome]
MFGCRPWNGNWRNYVSKSSSAWMLRESAGRRSVRSSGSCWPGKHDLWTSGKSGCATSSSWRGARAWNRMHVPTPL